MSYLPFIGIISLFLLILFGSHAIVYATLTSLFSFSASAKKALIASLTVLAVSFFLASFLAHWKDIALTRALYVASGWWLGLLNQLVLGAVIVSIALFITGRLGMNLPLSMVGIVYVVLSIGITAYGIWNAAHPQLKYVEISIPNLPENWKEKTIVQISDVHLGHVYRQKSLADTVEKINSVRPEVVLITGDLFDGMDGQLSTLTSPLAELQSRYGTFFITGNHETYLGLKQTFDALRDTNVKALRNEVIDVDGLKLIGLDYPERGSLDNVDETIRFLSPKFSGQPNILMYHSPTHIDAFRQAGVNLQLSGHTHKGQMFPFGLVTAFIYKGLDYGLHTMGNYSIYTSNGVGTWGPPVRIGNTPEIVVITLK